MRSSVLLGYAGEGLFSIWGHISHFMLDFGVDGLFVCFGLSLGGVSVVALSFGVILYWFGWRDMLCLTRGSELKKEDVQ